MFHPWSGKIPWRRAWQPTPVFLPGESPWTEEPGGLQSMGSQRVGHDWETKHSTQFLEEQTVTFFFFFKILYFIFLNVFIYFYFGLLWVFIIVHRLSLVVESRGYSLSSSAGTSHCSAFSCCRARALGTCCCCCCCWVASVVADSVRPPRWQPTRLPRPWIPHGLQ